MSDAERQDARRYRRLAKFPKHSPPHFDSDLNVNYILSGTCYEHSHIIGMSNTRMSEFQESLLDTLSEHCSNIPAWCILPNHYHALVKTNRMTALRKDIGLLNGRKSFEWNGEDDRRGRKVWHNCFERKMRSERHYFATLNYILNNPVHHGYVNRWEDWPWSSASDYLQTTGRERAIEIWTEYPILDYGSKWDVD